MSIAVFLGIDIGTSGIRGSCIDIDGTEICQHDISFSSSATSHQYVNEQNPNTWRILLTDLISYLSQSLHDLNDEHCITAIAIDGTSATLIACDKAGNALSPAMMYSDSQSKTQAEKIRQFAPANSAVHGASSSLAKALFLIERYPETEMLCHQANWLAASLTGQYQIADENNCLKLGYDSNTQSWPEWISHNDQHAVIAPELLPEVVAPGDVTGTIKPELIEQFKLDDHCIMVAGTTDSNAAVMATGASQPGDAVTSLGSTLVIKLFTEKPVFDARYGIYSHRLNNCWLAGGASNSGGRVLLQHFSQQQIDELSLQLKPDIDTGLDYYPLPAIGERFPINDSNKRSRTEPRPESDRLFFQGLLEGIANIEADGYHKLNALGAGEPTQIYSAGGGSKNSAWCRIRERISGTRVITAMHKEACYGTALLALKGFQKHQLQSGT